MTRRLPRTLFTLALLSLTLGTVASGNPPSRTQKPMGSPRDISAAEKRRARLAFTQVARVLMSPRCSNCHPADGVPRQTDRARPHRFNISRQSSESGLPCSTCHQERNSEAIGISGGPPGAPHWQLPPKKTPMPFRKRTPASLCEQLKDRTRNGDRSLNDLLHHVTHDPLVLWGWKPGGRRTKPPLSHKKFIAAFSTWVKGGGACPEPNQPGRNP